MLTQEQKDLMTDILQSDMEVASDRANVTAIGNLPADNTLEKFNIYNTGYPEGFQQRVVSVVSGNETEYYIYTQSLICGHAPGDIDHANSLLDDRETNEITDKLTDLKNTIQ